MKEGQMILGKDEIYSMDSFKTGLNNNVLVIGASGAGKTRHFVSTNLLEAYGSYIVTDPKGNLFQKYKLYLEKKGYVVKKLDFTDPKNSICYNPFQYILDDTDIVRIAHILMGTDKVLTGNDEFWRDASELLLQAVISYMMEVDRPEERTFKHMLELLDMFVVIVFFIDCT